MKLSKTIKSIIVVASISLITLGLSIGSAFYTVNRSKNSIDEIGDITIDEDYTLLKVKQRIDKAIDDYNKLDRNLSLETKIDNINVLEEKKIELVSASILLANSIDQQKVKLNLSNEDVAKYVKDIEEYKETYITDDIFVKLENYSKYLVLKDKYKDYFDTSSSKAENTSNSTSEEIEIC